MTLPKQLLEDGRRKTKMRRVWKSKLQPRPAESNHSCSSSASDHMTTASHAHVSSGSAKLQFPVNTAEEEQRLRPVVRRCLVREDRHQTDASVHGSWCQRNSTTASGRKHRAEAEYVPPTGSVSSAEPDTVCCLVTCYRHPPVQEDCDIRDSF